MDEIARRLDAIAALWNKIEARAKQAEQFRQEFIAATINELRYAGRRIVDVLALRSNAPDNEDTRSKINEHLIVAQNYLVNADHDITDSICFFAHRRFSRTVQRHGLNKIYIFCPAFCDIYPEMKRVNVIIQESRETRVNRIDDYEKIKNDYLPKILSLYEQLTHIPQLALDEPDIHAIRNRVIWTRRFAAIASVAGILALMISICAWIWPWQDFKALFF